MCGLAGLLTSRRRSASGLRELTARMADPLSHRGPDDSGTFVDPEHGIGFGFRRLAIFDLSETGHQPMESPAGRFVGVLNGEIYNHPELRRELRDLGSSFRGSSDTEVLLAAVEEWGVRTAVERFIGMFAVALWDRKTERLLLVRDRLGIKPLYVFQAPGLVCFCSELKSLFALPDFRPGLDAGAVASFLRYLYVPAPASIFSDVRKLQPGTIAEFSDPGSPPTITRYWDLAEVARRGQGRTIQGSEPEMARRTWDLFTDSVRMRLRSDVPVGVLLSGGIDSSLLATACFEAGRETLRTFTVSFDVDRHDESGPASTVASHLNTDHTELRVTGEDALALVEDLPRLFDEPHANPSQIPTHLISRAARKDVTVALAGDGGDELFGGYNRYIYGRKFIPRLAPLPEVARNVLAKPLGLLTADAWDEIGRRVPRAGRFVDTRLFGSKIQKLRAMLAAETPVEMYETLLSSGTDVSHLLARGSGEDYPVVLRSAWNGARSDPLRSMMLSDQRFYLPDDLLAKVDRASMAVGLEVRVPFLDHRLLEYSWTLPTGALIRNGSGKWLLRQIARNKLPRSVVERSKVGFTVPIEEWLRGPLREWGAEMLRAHGSCGGLVEESALWTTWKQFQAGRSGLALPLWALVSLASWSGHWLESSVPRHRGLR